jgi:hypothetical protein
MRNKYVQKKKRMSWNIKKKSSRTVQHVLDEKEKILCQFAAVKMALGKHMLPRMI